MVLHDRWSLGTDDAYLESPLGSRGVSMTDVRDTRAVDAGRAWADAVRERLHAEGRRAAGGWPGTLSEAKARLVDTLGPGAMLSPEDQSRLARVLYAAARDCWMVHREPALRDE